MSTEEIGARLSLKDRKKFSDDANRAAKDVKDIGDAADKADKAGRNMGSGMGIARSGLGGLTSVAKLGVTAVAGLAVGLGALGAKTIGLAMDAGETQSKFNTVFKGMEADVSSFVTQMNADYGIPTKQLQDAASTFGVFGKAAGVANDDLAKFSTDLVSAGTDMASFYNAPVEDVFLALRSGLSGEAEPLRQFGIFLSDASLGAFALEKGIDKSVSAMSEQEKVALRQEFILAKMGDAQGDLARTSDSLSNKWKALKGRLTEAGTAIGTAFLPYAEKLVNVLDAKLGPVVAEMTRTAPMVGDAFRAAFAEGDVTTELWSLVGLAERAGVMFRDIKGVYDALAGSFKAGGIGGVVSDFDAMLGTGDLLRSTFDTLRGIFDHVGTIVQDLFLPAIVSVNEAIPKGVRPLEQVEAVLGFIADNAKTLKPILVGLVAATVAWKAANLLANGVLATQTFLQKANTGTLKAHVVQSKLAQAATALWTGAQWLLNAALSMNPIGLVVIAIVALIAIFVLAWKHSETFRNVVTGAFTAVKNAVMTAFNWVRDNWPLLLAILTGPIGLAVLAIVRNWDTIKEGISAVKDWIGEKIGQVVGFFTGLPGRISSAVSGMFNGIKNAFKSAVNWIIDKWNSLEFTIGGIKIDPPGPGSITIPSATMGTPNIPRLHSGGTTTSAGAVNMLPGEEIVFLPPAATVVPLNDTVRDMATSAAGGGGWGDGDIVIQIDGREIVRATKQQVQNEAARR